MSESRLTRSHLRLAGWLSLSSAIITPPLLVLGFVATNTKAYANEFLLLNTLLLILITGAYCYAYFTFRDYLKRHVSFHGADRSITILIGISVAMAVFEVIGYMFPAMNSSILLLMALLFIPLGIVSIQLGLSLFTLKDTLFGLRNVFSYLSIFFGIFLMSIILAIPAIFLGMLLDIILGIILIRAGTEHEK